MPVQMYGFATDLPTNPLHHVVQDADAFQEMVNRMSAAQSVTFDFETSGTQWFKDSKSCGIALASWDTDANIHSYYVPYRHKTGERQLDYERIAPDVKRILENQYTTKIAHNFKFDLHFARIEGWNVSGSRYDTMVAARLYNENENIGLKHRAKTDLGIQVGDWEAPLTKEIYRLAKRNKMKIKPYRAMVGYSEIPVHLCGTYACWDAEYTTRLYWHYERWGVSKKYERIWPTEMELVGVLAEMEANGLPLNREYLEVLRDSLGGELAALEEKIFEYTGYEFNVSSDADVRDFLLQKLRLPLEKKTKGLQYCVDKEVLSFFADRHPAIPLILEWRDAEKLANTYTTSLLSLLDANDVLHTNFLSVGTNSGRLSSNSPNFQNQPTDSDARAREHSGLGLEEGGIDPWSIRRAFVVRDAKIPRLFFDYSQVELRVLAFYSQDPIMTDAYLKGEDIHTRTSMEVFGTAEKAKRRISKVANFGIVYCLSEEGLSRQVHIPLDQAKQFMQKFFERYHSVASFREHLWNQMLMNDCRFTNLFGRTRYCPDLMADEMWRRGRAQRQAIGSLIQGTAAELTKESLVRVYHFLKSEFPEAKLVNTVHDEIQIDCPVDCLTAVVKGIKRRMEDFPELQPIPIVVDGDYTTTNWAEKKSLPI